MRFRVIGNAPLLEARFKKSRWAMFALIELERR